MRPRLVRGRHERAPRRGVGLLRPGQERLRRRRHGRRRDPGKIYPEACCQVNVARLPPEMQYKLTLDFRRQPGYEMCNIREVVARIIDPGQ